MDVLMPQLGETVAEGKIVKWFKSAGDAVKPGDNLFEIETDKTSMEVPATSAGTLAEIRFGVGEVAKVGAVVAVIAGAGETSEPQAPLPWLHSKNSAHSRESGNPGPSNWVPAYAGTNGRMRLSRPSRWIPSAKCARPNAIIGPAKLPSGAFTTPLARRLASERGIDLVTRHRLRPAWPHRRARRRKGSAGRARAGHRRQRRAGQGIVRRHRLRGSAARRHAPHHRQAADRGQADHPAFLSHRRYRRRPAPRHARGGQCRGASRQGRPAGVQALAQRLHHQGLGGGAAAHASRQCGVGGGPHPALQALRYRRGGGDRGRADHAGDPQRRGQIAHRDLGGNARSRRARPRAKSSSRTNTRAAPAPSPISACTACANSPPSSIRRMPPSWRWAPRGARRSRARTAASNSSAR